MVTVMSRPAVEPGGPLSRAANAVYWALAIEVLWLLTAAPGLVPALFLEQHPSNIPLYALAALPLGPATAAAVFAWRVFLRERDPSPVHQFGRGLRMAWLDALRSWALALVVLVVLGTNLAYRDAAGVGGPLVLLYVVLGAVTLLWGVRMLVLAATFTFRWRDAARLGLYTLVTRPLVTLGLLSVLVVAAGIAFVTFDAVTVLLASVLVLLVVRNDAPVIADVEERFVAH
jgi:uncharacterized membrane protein YesL